MKTYSRRLQLPGIRAGRLSVTYVLANIPLQVHDKDRICVDNILAPSIMSAPVLICRTTLFKSFVWLSPRACMTSSLLWYSCQVRYLFIHQSTTSGSVLMLHLMMRLVFVWPRIQVKSSYNGPPLPTGIWTQFATIATTATGVSHHPISGSKLSDGIFPTFLYLYSITFIVLSFRPLENLKTCLSSLHTEISTLQTQMDDHKTALQSNSESWR